MASPSGTVPHDDLPDHLQAIADPTPPIASARPVFHDATPVVSPEASSALVGFGAGLNDVYRGGKVLATKIASHVTTGDLSQRLAKSADDQITSNQSDDELYAQGRGPHTGVDWWRLGGNILATLPASEIRAGAGIWSALRAGALAGGASGGLLGEGTGDGLHGAAVGAAAGGALGVAGRVIGKGVSSAWQKIQGAGKGVADGAALDGDVQSALQDHGLHSVELSDAQKAALNHEAGQQIEKTGSVDARALARKANLESLGLKPTSAQITKDPDMWTAEREASKQPSGVPLQRRYMFQQSRLKGLFDQWKQSLDGASPSSIDAVDSLKQSVAAKFKETQPDVERAYSEILDAPSTQTSGLTPSINHGGLAPPPATVADEIGMRPVEINKAINDAAILKGTSQGNAVKIVSAKLKELSEDGKKPLSVGAAESLRKLLGESIENAQTNTEKMYLVGIQRGLDQDVLTTKGQDVLAPARAQARERFNDFDTVSHKVLLKGEDAPDTLRPEAFFNEHVLHGNPHNLTALKETLTTGNNLQVNRGTQSWNDLRGQVGQWIFDKATNSNPDSVMSPAGMRRALNSIGPDRLKVLFDPDELAHLRRLESATADIHEAPPFNAVNHSNTSSALKRVVDNAGTNAVGAIHPMLGLAQKLGNAALLGKSERDAVNQALTGSSVNASKLLPTAPVNSLPANVGGQIGASAAPLAAAAEQ